MLVKPSFVNDMLFQAMLVPMTENLLGWDEFANSIFFCVAGVEVRVSKEL